MRAGIYARVSTDEQVSGYSLDAQLRACRNLCHERGWQIAGEYLEPGESAKHDDTRKRPAFQRMMQDAEAGRFDVWVVHKLDRFVRNLLVQLTCFQRLDRAGVSFLSVLEQADYTTPQGRLFLQISGAVAEWYSNNLSQETRKGKQERKRQGLYNGLLPFGLAKGPDRLPVPDERPRANGSTNWQGYLHAVGLGAAGRSDAEIAAALNALGYRTTGNRGENPFRKDTVRHLLLNRLPLGELPDGNGGWLPGKHPCYAPLDLWEKARAAREARLKDRAAHSVAHSRRTYALTGLLRCGYCLDAGRTPATVQISGGERASCRCYSRQQGLPCQQPSVRYSLVERQVEEWVAGLVVSEEAAAGVAADPGSDGQREDGERRRIVARLVRLAELYSWGDLTRQEYQAERDRLRARLAELEAERPGVVDREALATLLRSAAATWQSASEEERHDLALALIERVVLKDSQAVAIVPRPEVARLVRDQPSVWSCGSDGGRSTTTAPCHPAGLPSRLLALTAAERGIAAAARELGVSRQTVRQALEAWGLSSPWAACERDPRLAGPGVQEEGGGQVGAISRRSPRTLLRAALSSRVPALPGCRTTGTADGC